MNVLSIFKNIKAFILDVDGVLTDGSLLILNDGQMVRRMNIKDGYALQLAIKKGYPILVISGGDSDAVITRLQKLGLNEIFMKVADKKPHVLTFMSKYGLSAEEVLYMGDDMPDLEAMQLAGLPCCPADAVSDIKSISKYISPIEGGYGCVRDVIEKVMKLRGHWSHDQNIVSR